MKKRRQTSSQPNALILMLIALLAAAAVVHLCHYCAMAPLSVSAATITVQQPLGMNITNSTYYSFDTLMIDWTTDVAPQNESLYNIWLLSAALEQQQQQSTSALPPIYLILENGLPRLDDGGYDYVIEGFIPSGEYWVRVASAQKPTKFYGDSARFNITQALELKPPNPWWIWVLLAFVIFGCCANYLCQCVSCWSRIVCEMLAER